MNEIGLNKAKSEKLAESLNDLLANYQIFYSNVRGFHWNIKGEKFFELHVKFEELYNDLIIKIDELAERILTLGFTPEYKYSVYLPISEIKEAKQSSNGILNAKSVLTGLQILIAKQRELLAITSEINDEGTSSLMSDYVREQEKLSWMYTAFLHSDS